MKAFFYLAGALIVGAMIRRAPAQPATAPAADAAALIQDAKQGQDWLAKVKSLRVKIERQSTSHPRPPATNPAATQQAASRTPATGPTTSRQQTYTSEMAFDDHRLYSVSTSPLNNARTFFFWDGQITGRSAREGYYESLDTSDSVRRSFMTSETWGRNGQIYWWTADRQAQDDFLGRGAPYRLTGTEMFHGTECYVLQSERLPIRCDIGLTDHRLYGTEQYSSIEWWSDYKEVAPGCWYPMTSGTDTWVSPPGVPKYLNSESIARVTEIAVDQPLPEELFHPFIKDGTHVHETRGGVDRDYVYKAERSREEYLEMLADAARRKLFAPPPLPQGQPILLNPPLDLLPLSPLALKPAADFPANATWLNGEPRKLADLRGKVVLILFWATWQDFSEGIWGNNHKPPDLKLLDPLKPEVAVLGVHVPTKEHAKVEKAIKDYGFEFPVCIDFPVPQSGWGTMAEQYRVDEIPVVYVIDQEGKVAALGSWTEAIRRAGELLGKPVIQH